MFTDTHCHLEQLDDPESALKRAREVGVARVVAVAEDLASMESILKLRDAFPGQVLLGVGFHPMFTPSRAVREIDAALKRVEELAPQAAVVGEIGLDFKYAQEEEQKSYQREVLQRQLEIAARFGKPINLHSRWAQRQTMEVAIEFTRETGLGAQLHWFTQSKKLIRRTNEAGVYVSVGPSVLSSEEARAVTATIRPDLLLLETDGPVPFGGSSAEPSWIPRVAGVVAELWGCTLEEVGRRTEENFQRLLGRS